MNKVIAEIKKIHYPKFDALMKMFIESLIFIILLCAFFYLANFIVGMMMRLA